YSTLSPRRPIQAVPYAMHAATATTAGSLSGTLPASQLTGTLSTNNFAAGSITSTMLASGAVGSDQLADGAVTAGKMATALNWFLATTIANPTPAVGDQFGCSVAAVGTDRVLIGAYRDDTGADNAGAAYLFSTSGTLLTTFTNPTPVASDNFGISVSAVGTELVVIGAHQDGTAGPSGAGAAYLFSTNGTLLTTFTNPTPATDDNFGISVAAVGTDRVLIGAYRDNTGADNAGAAFLFSTNGALLAKFTRPTAEEGAHFGFSVAAVGTDRVLIGAYLDNTGADNAGAAYLFNTNGAWLATFTNPTPGAGDEFGYAVAAVGTDRVLIGAHGTDAGASDAGAAYLISTEGTLLATFTKPTPKAGDHFGISLVAIGTNQAVIGAYRDDTGKYDAGAAHLFNLEHYAPGLLAEGVKAGSITTASLDPGIGVWTLSGDNAYRSTGNVGVGTDNPHKRFEVVAHGTADGLRVEGDGYPPAIQLSTNGTVSGELGVAVAAGNYSTDASPGDFVIRSGPGNKLLLQSGGSGAALAITANNQVGIGTPSPRSALDVNGTVTATAFVGNGAGLTNVALLNTNQVFTGSNRFAGVVTLTNAANTFVGAFTGNGGGLTNLDAADLTGTLADARLSANVALLNANQVFTGTNTFSAPVGLGNTLANTKLALWGGGASSYGLGVQSGQFLLHLNAASDRFSFFDNAGGSNELVTIKGNGFVGIGTITPQKHLDVRATSTADGLRVDGYGSAVAPTIQLSTNGTVCGDLSAAVTSGQYSANASAGDFVIRSGAGSKLLLQNSSGSAAVTINNNLVGIGTPAPARTLHVSDVMRLQPRSSAPSSPGEGDLYYDSALHKLRVYDGTSWQNCW
ncbi:MAG TPA: hypothetical protein VI136_05870, partial [Verrucomicrobiae bacterium]